jgi:hypothetical protein
MTLLLAKIKISLGGGLFLRPKRAIEMILSPMPQVTGIGFQDLYFCGQISGSATNKTFPQKLVAWLFVGCRSQFKLSSVFALAELEYLFRKNEDPKTVCLLALRARG